MPRISSAYQFIAAKSVLMAAATTYTFHLWTTDPGNMAAISAISLQTGSTYLVTTTLAHSLTSSPTALPTIITGVVSSSGAGSGHLQTLINGVTLTPTVVNSTQFTVTLASTASDSYTSGGTVGAGGEVSGGSYGAQSVTFTGNNPVVQNNGNVVFTSMPGISAPGANIPTLYGVVFDNSSNYVAGGATNLTNVAIIAGSNVQFSTGQIVGAWT